MLAALGLLVGVLVLELGMRVALDPYTCDDALGWRYRQGATFVKISRDLEVFRVVQLNGAGFHDSHQLTDKRPGTYRVALLGDSVVAGVQVDIAANMASVAQQLAPRLKDGRRVEVLNFGVDGYSTAQQALLLQQLWRWSPDAVVAGFFAGNDLTDNLPGLGDVGHYLAARCGRPYAVNGKLLRVDPPAIGVAAQLEQLLLRHSVAWSNLVRKRTGPDRGAMPVFQQDYSKRMVAAWKAGGAVALELLGRLADDARKHRADFAVMLLPELRDVLPDARKKAEKSGLQRPDAPLRAGLSKRAIATIDVYARLDRPKSDATTCYLPDMVHLNERGHAVAAEVLAQWLKQR